VARKRARHVQADNEYPDSDEDVDPWDRKPYFESRRAAEHLRRREKERLEDEKDAKEEMREQAVHAAVQKEQQAKVMAAADKANNAFYQAMAAAITPSQKSAAGKGGIVIASSQQTPGGGSGSAHKKLPTTRASAFAEEDEEDEDDKKQRRLIPLKYNEQELKMDASAEEERREDAVDPQVIRKKLVSLLPKTLSELIQYPIKWEAFEYASSETHDRISAWIDKKITEFMGGEEPSFCAFIVEQVRSQTSPGDMLKSLQSVLDEDTEDFVRKLYQVLIYETEKIIIKRK
jgi:RNA-binding protein 25